MYRLLSRVNDKAKRSGMMVMTVTVVVEQKRSGRDKVNKLTKTIADKRGMCGMRRIQAKVGCNKNNGNMCKQNSTDSASWLIIMSTKG